MPAPSESISAAPLNSVVIAAMPSRVHIPMLILDTRSDLPRGVRTDQLASQMDILATIMGMVRLDYDDYSFGRDLLDSTSTVEPFAYLSEWYYIGFIQNGYYLVSPQRGRGSPPLRIRKCAAYSDFGHVNISN